MHHLLIIQFKKRERSLIFKGKSYLRKNLVDEVSIYYDRIILSFDRTKSVNLQNCLFSQKSLFRYEIQKSLCFYLAVTGVIPEVKEIWLERNDENQYLEDISFAKEWSTCTVRRVLKPEVLACIFETGQESRVLYTVLTFYLKAQMDHSHDSFRAAWSGLNALYTALAPSGASWERDKIEALRPYFDMDSLSEIREKVSMLNDSFWKELDWYSFTRNLCVERGKVKSIDKVIEPVYNLQDSMLIRTITDYMRSTIYTDKDENSGEKADNERLRKEINKKENEISGKKADFERRRREIDRKVNEYGVSYSSRAYFLVIQYCYMLRNRSFHAEKAYPIFAIYDVGAGQTIEEYLTNLILMTIEGLLAELHSQLNR